MLKKMTVVGVFMLAIGVAGATHPASAKRVISYVKMCCGGPGPICPGSPNCPVVR